MQSIFASIIGVVVGITAPSMGSASEFEALKRDPSAACWLSPSDQSETCCSTTQCCTNSHLDNVYSCSSRTIRVKLKPM